MVAHDEAHLSKQFVKKVDIPREHQNIRFKLIFN